MNAKKRHSFLYRNSLSIVVITLMLVFWAAQAYTGWKEYNKELAEYHQEAIGLGQYLTSGHFLQSTFENWESEFLQMALYVMLTVSLRQIGSSESKPMEGEEEVDREPKPHKDAPWPVKKGGFALKLYQNSLSLVLFLLFLISFGLHAYGSWMDFNVEQQLKNQPTETFSKYITDTRFWFESFQNWQSEFLAVAAIVILSIFLRQKGSPESKPVDAPYYETGE
ncbi:MAG: DUF6766 family protein [Sphingobacteriaceae bacterium]